MDKQETLAKIANSLAELDSETLKKSLEDATHNKISVQDQWDYISTILSTGRIKDMDAQHFLASEKIENIGKKIRKHIKKVVGE